MNLADAILSMMLRAAPPGKSFWSVEPVPAAVCAPLALACPQARRSSFYGTWVRQESKEAGTARYRVKAAALAAELEGDPRAPWWAGLVVAIEVNESGLREDVMVGRGRSGRTKPTDKQYDDAGGQGRGPGNEACGMQILPSMAAKFGGVAKLLGGSPEALRLCYRAGLEQLRWAHMMCSSEKSRRLGKSVTVGRLYATISRYGNGHSCVSSNQGKTERRMQTASWTIPEVERLVKLANEEGHTS